MRGSMFLRKMRPGPVHIKTLARKWLADELLEKAVEKIRFEFHMPYLLDAACPIQRCVTGLDGEQVTFAFSRVQKKTIYSDSHELASPYTLISAELRWEPRRILRSFMAAPLAVLTEFPLHFINGLLDSYQFLTQDYTGKHIGAMELEYLPGEIWLVGDDEPLKLVTHHQKTLPERPSIESDLWLHYSATMLLDTPKVHGAKLFNDARRALHDHDWKTVFTDAVTCIEVLASEVCRLIASMSPELRRVSKLRGLRRMLLEGLPHHPTIASDALSYKRVASAWLSGVYVTRNRIVHAGFSELAHDEVATALTITGDLARILDRLIPEVTDQGEGAD